jgi:hypothetical protein
MSEEEKFVDNTQVPTATRKKRDAEMMEAVLKQEKEGWSRISSTTLQFIRPTGHGFVLFVRGQWEWMADRNGTPRETGTCSLLEAAMQEVQNVIND